MEISIRKFWELTTFKAERFLTFLSLNEILHYCSEKIYFTLNHLNVVKVDKIVKNNSLNYEKIT